MRDMRIHRSAGAAADPSRQRLFLEEPFVSPTTGQVFWLPDLTTFCTFPRQVSRVKAKVGRPGELHAVAFADFVPGYSGGTATDLHRFPYSSVRTHFRADTHVACDRIVAIPFVNPAGSCGRRIARREQYAESVSQPKPRVHRPMPVNPGCSTTFDRTLQRVPQGPRPGLPSPCNPFRVVRRSTAHTQGWPARRPTLGFGGLTPSAYYNVVKFESTC